MPSHDESRGALLSRLETLLPRAQALEVASAIGALPVPVSPTVCDLLDELRELSSKILQHAVEALPDLARREALEAIVPWLDLGVAVAGSSGAAAMKYFRESPLALGLIEEKAARAEVLTIALELAEQDANVALDFVRSSPELLTALSLGDLRAWADVGMELARLDYVLGIEFFRQSPAAARVVPLAFVRDWVGFGVKLVAKNSLGKTDYVGTLEFFRTSPGLLREVDPPLVRHELIRFGSLLADRSPQMAMEVLAEAPMILQALPSEGWRVRALRYGALLGERDAEAAVAYLRRCPEIVGLVGEDAAAEHRFDDWYRGGMDVLTYSAEAARAYFALETRKALASVEEAMSGVPLRRVARSLKLFAEGLAGTEVTIRALPESSDESEKTVRPVVSADGRTIMLPSVVRRYATADENLRFYTVMTAHEAGHLEFGTYRLAFDEIAALVHDVRARYGRPGDGPVTTLHELFALYPQRALIQDLWTVLEDARVEYRLQHDYPGLRRDLADLARDSVRTRSLSHGLTVREMIVDALLLLSTMDRGEVSIPDAIAGIVERVWGLCQSVLTPSASAEDTVRVADRVYLAMEDMLADVAPVLPPASDPPDLDQGAGPRASEETTGTYRPVTNWAYRGEMKPELIRAGNTDSDAGRQTSEPHTERHVPAGSMSDLRSDESGPPRPGSSVEELLEAENRQETGTAIPGQGTYLYDEWDGTIQDYRAGWCRVVERLAPSGEEDFIEQTLAAHAPAVRLLRRYFETIRPTGLRRLMGQPDGDDVDLDAAIRHAVERHAGADLSEGLYARRVKKEREVAVAFVVDLSGSTSRQIEHGRRVIDVEKEGLVLLCQALEAIGDQYGVYGYSGQGRRAVDFLVLKDFDEPLVRCITRFGGMAPLEQNRDGTAIRHAARKLLARPAKTRLLVLISDGKPLDDSYADEYSLEDTRMALREVRQQGIHPFCITVDREADDYLRRMYGEVQYLIIDQPGALPERLPRIYQRLTA